MEVRFCQPNVFINQEKVSYFFIKYLVHFVAFLLSLGCYREFLLVELFLPCQGYVNSLVLYLSGTYLLNPLRGKYA